MRTRKQSALVATVSIIYRGEHHNRNATKCRQLFVVVRLCVERRPHHLPQARRVVAPPPPPRASTQPPSQSSFTHKKTRTHNKQQKHDSAGPPSVRTPPTSLLPRAASCSQSCLYRTTTSIIAALFLSRAVSDAHHY